MLISYESKYMCEKPRSYTFLSLMRKRLSNNYKQVLLVISNVFLHKTKYETRCKLLIFNIVELKCKLLNH